MEKNEFLLCSEVIYRINVCRTVVELRGVLLAQLKLIIPYACASIIPIQEDPDSHEIRHGIPFCWPEACSSSPSVSGKTRSFPAGTDSLAAGVWPWAACPSTRQVSISPGTLSRELRF